MIKGTLIPSIRFDQRFLSLLLAVIGSTLSAYLYTWQPNQKVEEEIAMGWRRLVEGIVLELRHVRRSARAGS